MASDPSAANENPLPSEKDVHQQFIENWITGAAPALAQAARYMALVHDFDSTLLGFLQDTEEDMESPIARLKGDGLIAAVGPNRYSFEPSLRGPYLRRWQADDPEGYRRASGRAAEYYRSRQIDSETDRIEYVYHLLGADDSLGLQALRPEVERMLAEYRLGLAERLLQYAEEQMPILGTSARMWLRLFKARLELAHYNYQRSEETLRSILKTELEPRLRAEALMDLANTLVATQRWTEAFEHLDQALQIFLMLEDRSKAALILKAQGTTYLHLVSSLGGPQQATSGLQPLYQKWFYRIAFAPFRLYRSLSRRIDFLPSLYFGTDYQDWIIFRLLYQAIQYFEKATSQLAGKTEETSPTDTELLTDIQIYLADLYHRVGQWTKAARLFKILVNTKLVSHIDYRWATFQLVRGRASLTQSDLNEAREFLLDARRIFIQYSDHRALAATTRLLGDTEAAAKKPDDSVPFYAESVEASLIVDDLLESTHTASAVRELRQHFSFSLDAQSRIDALTQKLDRRAYLIRFRNVLLQRFRNLATRLAGNVFLPLVYLVMLIVGFPGVRPIVIGATTNLTCSVIPGCDTLLGDLLGSAFAIFVPILLAIWAYEFFYLVLGWISVRRLPLGDIAQLQTGFVVTFPAGITLRDEAGQLRELPWDKVDSHVSANRAIWRVPVALFSRQFLIVGEKLSVIDGIAHHYQSLRQDITERLEQTKNKGVQLIFDYAFFTAPWTIITLLLVTGMTTISILDVFDRTLCRRPNIIPLTLVTDQFVYGVTNDGNLNVAFVEPQPIRVQMRASYRLPGQAFAVAVKGKYVYVADGTEGLRIVDVSDPTNPVEVGFYDTPGQAKGVTVAGQYAFIADGPGGLLIVDVRDPTHPVKAGSYNTLGEAFGLAVNRNYVYIAAGTAGLQIINARHPASPVQAGFYDTPGTAYGVAVNGNYVYIADGSQGVRVVDVRDLTAPVQVGFYPTRGQATGITIANNLVYIVDGTQEMKVVYVQDLAATPQLITTQGVATNVAVMSGLGLAFISDDNQGLLVLNVLNPCDEGSRLNEADKNYVPMNSLINNLAVPSPVQRPISSISFEFFFWALLLFPIIGLARLIYNRISLRRIKPQLVLGADRPFWFALLLLIVLVVFHTWTLTW